MRSVLCGFFLLFGTNLAGAERLAVLASRADSQCVQFQTIGVCTRSTPPYVGAKVRYRQPALLVETVKVPGDSAVDEFRGMVRRLFHANAEAGASRGEDVSGVQFNEAHVFGFPFSDMFSSMIEAPCEGSPDYGGQVSYLSEVDCREWHEAAQERRHPLSVLTEKLAPVCDGRGSVLPGICMGSWGPLYPRQGFLPHYSQAVGSAATAYRAVDIASLNLLSPHRKVGTVMFMPDMFYDRMQMVYPVKSACLKVGDDPAGWENGRVSADGRYVWLYWRKKECCLF